MDAQRRSEITGWDAREFSDGFAELGVLVDREFSGAVTDGAGWLFVFEGRVVGATDADLDDFADASGTVYEAPDGALPLLFAMQEQGGEPRAQYYTNDTPLSEADRKLSRGGFTGYVELSENVLSGDYYVAYAAGESMSAAWVGNSRRLETGEKAFALADDEVGIYTVYEVDLTVRELPSGDADGDDGSPGVVATDDPTDGEGTGGAEAGDSEGDGDDVTGDDATGGETGHGETGHGEADRDETGRDETGRDETGRDDAADDAGGRDGDGAATTDPDSTGRDVPESTGTAGPESDASPRSGAENPRGQRAKDDRSAASAEATTPRDDEPEKVPSDDVFSEEEQWREQKSIPALDPSEASAPPAGNDGASSNSARSARRSRSENDAGRATDAEGRSSAPAPTETSPDPRSTGDAGSNRSAVSARSQRTSEAPGGGERGEQIRRLESALETAEEERKSLAAERDAIAEERDELSAKREQLEADIDRLESETATLREERDRLRDELSTARERLPESDRAISPAEARSGTNLFVRYDSKGGATLEDAHEGTVGRDELRENLRIEHHTSFETDGLTVDGRPFEEFLTDTIEYGFTRWLVEDLPFEVSGTGNESVLSDLYDAIPEVDRAEIGGSVSIAIRENGGETREQRTFDLVLRDRMGNPLFVADLNDSRDPTQEGTLESLVGNGRDIAESNESFAAAFAVTESFFEPGALETASDAVGGGLFSRSKRASFVKLSRKQGYHLCLVEARDGGFHMTVPDL